MFHKEEVIYLQTNLMGSRERFLYYDNDFETCKILKLQNFEKIGSKLEQVMKNLINLFWILRNLSSKLIKTEFFQFKLVSFWQDLSLFWSKLVIFW